MTRYASKTEVSAEKSRAEIETILARYGADQFMSGWKDGVAMLAFRAKGRNVRFLLPLPDPADPVFTTYKRSHYTHQRTAAAAQEAYQQAVRQRWRALALVIKAKLEAVETGIAEFEDEFLAHIMLPDGQTVSQYMRPQIATAYETGEMPSLLPDYSGGRP